MTSVLVDTSVLIKWFHDDGESQVDEARAIQDAARRRDLHTLIIDLALYELGNVLLRALRWDAAAIADQLDDLREICGTPVVMLPAWLRDAAALGTQHRLTFYDAAWAAAARALQVRLVSADAQLIRAGLAQSPAQAASRLGLR